MVNFLNVTLRVYYSNYFNKKIQRLIKLSEEDKEINQSEESEEEEVKLPVTTTVTPSPTLITMIKLELEGSAEETNPIEELWVNSNIYKRIDKTFTKKKLEELFSQFEESGEITFEDEILSMILLKDFNSVKEKIQYQRKLRNNLKFAKSGLVNSVLVNQLHSINPKKYPDFISVMKIKGEYGEIGETEISKSQISDVEEYFNLLQD